MNIKTGVGAYQQADLEGMGSAELWAVRAWAREAFNEHLAGHDDDAATCRRCAYLELLAGAADELIAKTPGEGCIVDDDGNVDDEAFHREILGEDF